MSRSNIDRPSDPDGASELQSAARAVAAELARAEAALTRLAAAVLGAAAAVDRAPATVLLGWEDAMLLATLPERLAVLGAALGAVRLHARFLAISPKAEARV
jgi:hypothetical protein